MTTVQRLVSRHRYRGGRGVLEQRFRFEGGSVDAESIARVLLNAPMIGTGSVFGNRPGREGERTTESRRLHGFSPAPGFRFDVELTRSEGSFIVRFAQPDRRVAYLRGCALWILSDQVGGAELDEQVNTERALAAVGEPLGGNRPSFRRRLFFTVGHKRVMVAAMRNVATLLEPRTPPADQAHHIE